MPLITDSSTLAPNKMNANTELYMQISSRNLMAFLSLVVKKTSNSCGVQEDSATKFYHSRNTKKIVDCCCLILPIVL